MHQNEAIPCVSLFGDSFTFAAEVSDSEAWGNVLAGLLGCRVANYGVGGYGSDQAFLAMKSRPADGAGVVFLNHLSENILRNVNQFRGLLYPGDGLGFKPRFVVESGQLELVPLLSLTRSDYASAMKMPERFFGHEYFLPGGPSGIERAEFPHVLAIVRSFRNYHLRAIMSKRPRHMDFYDSRHPAQGLQVTTTIMSSFVKEAEARGQTPVVTVIPTGSDLRYFQSHRVWSYQPLLDSLFELGIPVLNFGPGLMEGSSDDPCSLFNHCDAHFNEKGYALLADIAYEHIRTQNRMTVIDGAGQP